MSVVYVNGQSTSDQNLRKLLNDTGYFTNTDNDNRDFGKWFKLNNGELPDFMSVKTFQHSQEGENSGWKVSKKDYPDLWIEPKVSLFLLPPAAELISSPDKTISV